MQGIYINYDRPKSKKQVKEQAKDDPGKILIEATSIVGNEYGGRLDEMPHDVVVNFVGPDPRTNRKFYGTIQWNRTKDEWMVK